MQLNKARNIRCAQLLERAARARCALLDCARGQLCCEAECTRERVATLECAEEVDGLDGVRMLTRHGSAAEGAVLVPYGESVEKKGLHALVEDLVHIVLVRQPRDGGDTQFHESAAAK